MQEPFQNRSTIAQSGSQQTCKHLQEPMLYQNHSNVPACRELEAPARTDPQHRRRSATGTDALSGPGGQHARALRELMHMGTDPMVAAPLPAETLDRNKKTMLANTTTTWPARGCSTHSALCVPLNQWRAPGKRYSPRSRQATTPVYCAPRQDCSTLQGQRHPPCQGPTPLLHATSGTWCAEPEAVPVPCPGRDSGVAPGPLPAAMNHQQLASNYDERVLIPPPLKPVATHTSLLCRGRDCPGTTRGARLDPRPHWTDGMGSGSWSTRIASGDRPRHIGAWSKHVVARRHGSVKHTVSTSHHCCTSRRYSGARSGPAMGDLSRAWEPRCSCDAACHYSIEGTRCTQTAPAQYAGHLRSTEAGASAAAECHTAARQQSTTPQRGSRVPHRSAAAEYHTAARQQSTTPQRGSSVPHRSAAAEYHTAARQQSTTPPRGSRVPHRSAAAEYHTAARQQSTTQQRSSRVPHRSAAAEYDTAAQQQSTRPQRGSRVPHRSAAAEYHTAARQQSTTPQRSSRVPHRSAAAEYHTAARSPRPERRSKGLARGGS
jgi:hypothetical protein